jgi:hypothetical protein
MSQVVPRDDLGVLPERLLNLLRRFAHFQNWQGPGRITFGEVQYKLMEVLRDLI